MRTKIVAGNWKMNKDLEGTRALLKDLVAHLPQTSVAVMVAPPFVNLPEAVAQLQGVPVEVAAQNMHFADSGAYTGEISADMLMSVGVKTVILGHSERRAYFGEDDALLSKKVGKAIEKGMKVIFCFGEELADRYDKKHFEVVEKQLKNALFDLPETALALHLGTATILWRLIVDPGLDAHMEDLPLAEVVLAHAAALAALALARVILRPGRARAAAVLETGFITVAAILAFTRRPADWTLLEVGLGGRLDAVNLLDGDCTVITPVGLDHQEYLGDTREAIGYEKAGIIRRGRPLVLGDRDPPASVLDVARTLEAPVRRIGRDYELTGQGGRAMYRYDGRSLELPRPPLAGAHQFDNAATGLAAVLELLPDAIDQAGALRRGLDSVRVRGRFEQVAAAPAIWIDVGHNPLGAEVVARTLTERMPADGAGQVRCVFGMLADKDAAAVVRAMRAVVNGWYCAGLGSSRGQSGARLAAQVRAVVDPATVVRTVCTVAEALDAAWTFLQY